MKLKFRNDEERDAVVEYLSRLSFDKGKVYSVDAKRVNVNRSNSQNRLWQVWVSCIAREIDRPNKTVAKVLKKKFLGFDTIECMGELVGEVRDTHDLTVEQMTDFLNKVQEFAESKGILLPQPEDKIFAQFASRFED